MNKLYSCNLNYSPYLWPVIWPFAQTDLDGQKRTSPARSGAPNVWKQILTDPWRSCFMRLCSGRQCPRGTAAGLRPGGPDSLARLRCAPGYWSPRSGPGNRRQHTLTICIGNHARLTGALCATPVSTGNPKRIAKASGLGSHPAKGSAINPMRILYTSWIALT